MEMNAADGGSRQCILVTNNEVEEKKRKVLVKDGHFPGDDEFERHGIFRRVTYPRLKTVATGTREDGSTYSEGLGENVTFAEMTYTTQASVRLGRDFDTIAPLLWAKAGGRGSIALHKDGKDTGFTIKEGYAVLFDPSAGVVADFAKALEDSDLGDAVDVFVVTDDDDRYARAGQRLSNYTLHRLYEDYLSNFEVTA
jgi:adenine-specific DNA-methyltransferase